MKKTALIKSISLLLAFAACVSFASCGKNETPAENTGETSPADEITTQEVTTYAFDEKIKANGFLSSMLPEGFPDTLPLGMTCSSQSLFYADKETYGYDTDFYRLCLTGDSSSFSQLNSLMNINGFKGGLVIYTENHAVEGYWTNGSFCAKIADTTYDEESVLYSVNLDVYEVSSAFPEMLAKHFPQFDAVCLNSGRLEVYNSNGKKLEDYGNADSYRWLYTFNDKDLFVGVEFNTLDEYVTALDAAGFSLSESEGENDFGSYCIITGTKTTGGKTYTVKINFIEYLSVAAIKYSNHDSLI